MSTVHNSQSNTKGKKEETIIRSSKQFLAPYANTNKINDLEIVLTEYRRLVNHYVDYFWNNKVSFTTKSGKQIEFDIQDNKYDIPSEIHYKYIPDDSGTWLSARLKGNATSDASKLVRSVTAKKAKQLYMYNKLKSEGTPKKKLNHLIKKLKLIPTQPSADKLKMVIDSKFFDLQETENGKFYGFIRIASIGNKMFIKIPVVSSKTFKKYKHHKLTATGISDNRVDLCWRIPKPAIKTSGNEIGVDQGMKDVVTCSNGFVPNKTCIHRHSLESIMRNMSNKKKGSKAFKRTQDHRTNFINWSINQLNLNNIKEVKFEEVVNIGFKQGRSRLMSHWTNTIIRDKLKSYCEEEGVRFTLVPSVYRSQRCNSCGIVRKSNRKGKEYKCKHCGYTADADLNASMNLLVDLPEIPYSLRKLQMNRGNGFYWKSDGIYEFGTGRRYESLPLKNKDK